MKLFSLTPDVALHVLIAGPAAATNESLSRLISDSPGRVVVNTATDARHALMLARWERPDVVLLDLETTGERLSRSISMLKKNVPPPEVIVLAHGVLPVLRSFCLELGATHGQAGEVEVAQVGVADVDPGQGRGAQADRSEVELREVRAREVRTREIGSRHDRLDERDVRHVGRVQVRGRQVRANPRGALR